MLLGYNTISKKSMSMMDLYIVNSDGELSELLNIFADADEPGLDYDKYDRKRSNLRMNKGKGKKSGFIEKLYKKYKTRDATKIWFEILKHEHCSAIIKVLKDDDDNFKDILVSHSTWTDYSEMLRVYKYYDFEFLGNNLALP